MKRLVVLVCIRLGGGASGANCVVTSHALKWSETAKHTTASQFLEKRQRPQPTTNTQHTTHNTQLRLNSLKNDSDHNQQPTTNNQHTTHNTQHNTQLRLNSLKNDSDQQPTTNTQHTTHNSLKNDNQQPTHNNQQPTHNNQHTTHNTQHTTHNCVSNP